MARLVRAIQPKAPATLKWNGFEVGRPDEPGDDEREDAPAFSG
jgi:hypothetical protein